MRAALGILLVALLAPAAQAGLRITSVEVQDDPLEPELQSTEVLMQGEADCTSLLVRLPPGSTSGVLLRVNGTGQNMLLNGLREILVDPSSCGVDQVAVPVNVTLQAFVQRAAPAMVPQTGTLTWDFEPSPLDGQDPGHAEAAFALRARPFVVPQATFDDVQAIVADEPVVFRATLRNLGNVAFMASGVAALADVRPGTGMTASLEVSQVVVDAGATGALAIAVGVPTGSWSSAHVIGNLSFVSTLEPRAEPRTIPFDFLLTRAGADQNQVEDLGIPLSLWVPLVALAVAALAARRAGGR